MKHHLNKLIQAKPNKFVVTAVVTFEVVGEHQSADATDVVIKTLAELPAPSLEMPRVTIVACDATRVPYATPPKVGGWLATARRFRFAEAKAFAYVEDGSWWWSDAHASLRCEGETVPFDEGGMVLRLKPPPAVSPLAQTDPKPTTWGDAFERIAPDECSHTVYRLAEANHGVAIQVSYLQMIGARAVSWRVGAEREPVHALDADGRVIACVMPILRADDEKLIDEPARRFSVVKS